MIPPFLVYFNGTYDLFELSEAINSTIGEGKNIIKKISLIKETDSYGNNFVIVEIVNGIEPMEKLAEELLNNSNTEKKFMYKYVFKYIEFSIKLYLKKYD